MPHPPKKYVVKIQLIVVNFTENSRSLEKVVRPKLGRKKAACS